MSGIKAGDLVMVVRGSACCGSDALIGKIFRVTGLETLASSRCTRCDQAWYIRTTFVQGLSPHSRDGIAIYHIKKLDPTADPDAEVYREEKKRSRELSKA